MDQVGSRLTRKLFKVDNIGSGNSQAELTKMGGTKALLVKLSTSLKGGITDNDLSKQRRREHFGSNQLVEPPSKTLWEIFIGCFDDLTLRILCVAAVVSLIIGVATEGFDDGWYESGAILTAIVIVVAITTANEHSQAEQFRNLFKRSQDKKVKVVRDGKLKEIDNQDLLVGDVFEVETGLIMPADCLLIEKHCKIL